MFKKLKMLFCLIPFMFLMTGCEVLQQINWGDLIGDIGEITNPSPEIEVGKIEDLPGNGGRYAYMVLDKRGQPHIVADEFGSGQYYTWHRVDNEWKYIHHQINASQYYNPQMSIDTRDRIWITGTTWYPHGTGITIIEKASKEPKLLHFEFNTGGFSGLPVGNIGTIEDKGIIYSGNGGHFGIMRFENGRLIRESGGNIAIGRGGEKNYFDVSNNGTWHAVTERWYNNNKRGGQLEWANWPKYPSIGHDMTYPVVSGDEVEEQIAYMASDFQQVQRMGIVLNVYRNGSMVVPSTDIMVVDSRGTSGGLRREPQISADPKGGAWLCYQRGPNIIVRYIPSTITGVQDLGREFSVEGYLGAIVAGEELVHLSFSRGGQRKYTTFKSEDYK
jgi:hypothetical protein